MGRKSQPYWLWLAIDRRTREVVGLQLGARDEAGAVALWESVPECYWDATAYTDFHGAYTAVL